MESDTIGGAINPATGGFISTFVTARMPTDAARTMEAPVLVPAGIGTANITGRTGDFSGLNVDPVNGTFWAANQFGGADGTPDNVIVNFEPLVFPAGISFTNGTLELCGDQNSTNENDTFKLERDSADPTMLDIFFNNSTATPTFTFPMASINKIVIYGGGGNNTLIVDSSNGLINVPQGIDWNAADPNPGNPISGEDGFNQTIFTQTAGPNAPTLTSDVYSVGPNAGDGMSVVTDNNGDTQTVNFFEVSPTFDNLPATTATVNATNANNAINYTNAFPAVAISNTTGAGVSPIVIATAVPNNFVTGDTVFVSGVTGNTNANGADTITVIDATHFSLDGTTGNAAYTGGGTVQDVTLSTTWGQVSVDNQEPYNFTNKTNLVINGLAGSDTININYATLNPITGELGHPAGLTQIAVDGGDPTGTTTTGDTVIVNGQSGHNDISVTYDDLTAVPFSTFGPTAPNFDEAVVNGAQQFTTLVAGALVPTSIPVQIDNAELLEIDGQGDSTGTGDNLNVTAAGGVYDGLLNVMTLTPGSDRDAGLIQANTLTGIDAAGLGVTADTLLPIQYMHLGGTPVPPVQVASEPPTFVPNTTANLITLGPAITVVYNGTTANDTFEVSPGGNVTLVSTPNNTLSTYVTVAPATNPVTGAIEVNNLRLNGLAGDDTFDIYENQTYSSILVNGQESSSSGSNVLNLIGSAPSEGTAGIDNFAVNFFASQVPVGLPLLDGFPVPVEITDTNVSPANTIGIVGLDSVNIDGNGGADTLTANGTVQNDLFTYTPADTDERGTGVLGDEGTFTDAGFNTTFAFDEIGTAAGSFTINGGPAPERPAPTTPATPTRW